MDGSRRLLSAWAAISIAACTGSATGTDASADTPPAARSAAPSTPSPAAAPAPDRPTGPAAATQPSAPPTTPSAPAAAARAADSGKPPDAPADTAPQPQPAGPPAGPGSFTIFDQIPQFGIYATTDPVGYAPPPGVLMSNHGTVFAVKLSQEQKAQIGADLTARITYHAQCDDFDRLGGLFFMLLEPGEQPSESSQRLELVRFITPFSNYMRGALATYVFPDADIATYAASLADPTRDVWIGIAGGSNPYDGDPCTNTDQPDTFKAVGFKYSLEFVSNEPLAASPSTTLTALYNVSAKTLPITGTFTLDAQAAVSGRVTVVISGHGPEAGGNEYLNTADSLSVNGQPIGSFSTQIDCADYARYSPDGNPGIFQRNQANNPRNWCPGALVAPHTFAAQLEPGENSVQLEIEPAQMPEGSYYATSISFSAP